MTWEIAKWKDVIEIRSGRSQKEVESPDGEYPIFGSGGNVMGYAKKFLCEEGTTIIGRKGSINQPFFIEEPFWNVDTAFGLHAGERLTKRFLFYFCLSFDFTTRDKGSGRPSLVKSDLYEMVMPVPPLEEQERIVNVLDEAFASIDKAKANIERNIENAKELFQSQQETYIQLLSKDLSLTPITDVCEKIFAGGDKPKDFFSKTKTDECQIPIISNGEKNDGLYGFTKSPKVTKSSITVSARGTIGYTVFRNYPFVPIVRLIVLTPKDDIIAPEYLMRVLQSLDILRTGSSIPQLTVPMIKTYSIPVPSIEKQKELVGSLNQLEKLTKSSISIYEKELENLEKLKNSMLQKAFTGELTNKSVAA